MKTNSKIRATQILLLLLATLLVTSCGPSDPADNGFTWPDEKKERRGSF